jgi:Ca2+-binding RTX toxin-like protein
MTAKLIAAAAVVALTLVVVPAAQAGSVSYGSGGASLIFSGGNETNALTITLDPGGTTYTLTDSTAITAQAPCSPLSGTTVQCPAAGVTEVRALLGAGDDSVTLDAPTPSFLGGEDGTDTLTGGSGPDTIDGGNGDDTVNGRDGNDDLDEEGFQTTVPGTNHLSGGNGNDLLTGHAGVDTLDGGAGDDTLRGGAAADVLMGGPGADYLAGQDGADSESGGDGDDQLGIDPGLAVGTGGVDGGNDSLDGGPGNDLLSGGTGPSAGSTDADSLVGGDGTDTVTYAGRTASVTLIADGAPDDGSSGENDNIGAGVETIVGGSGDDHITGGPAGETLDGARGSDVIDGGGGNDLVDGGADDASGDDLQGGDGDDTVRGEGGDDGITGDAGSDILDGGAGGDAMDGGPGDDQMTGGMGDDTIQGGAGNDVEQGGGPGLAGPDGRDIVDGGDGADKLDGGDENDTLSGDAGPDDLTGGGGDDTAQYLTGTAPVDVTLDGVKNDGPAGELDDVHTDVEDVAGGSHEDTFTGNAKANTLDGGGGEDYVDGKAGADKVTGGSGGDVLMARDGSRLDRGTCGRGLDLAIADPGDSISKDCEFVDRQRGDHPVQGRLMAIAPHGRRLRFILRGAHRFVPLTTHVNMPVGSTLDATSGKLHLVLAAGLRKRANGTFSGGAFSVRQPGGGLAGELTLAGGNFAQCNAAARAGVSAARTRVIRRLTGSGRGRFRTRGRHSTATVRGTAWTVIDRCDGTLTKVQRGVVIVRDLGTGRTIILRSGEQYLAKSRR